MINFMKNIINKQWKKISVVMLGSLLAHCVVHPITQIRGNIQDLLPYSDRRVSELEKRISSDFSKWTRTKYALWSCAGLIGAFSMYKMLSQDNLHGSPLNIKLNLTNRVEEGNSQDNSADSDSQPREPDAGESQSGSNNEQPSRPFSSQFENAITENLQKMINLSIQENARRRNDRTVAPAMPDSLFDKAKGTCKYVCNGGLSLFKNTVKDTARLWYVGLVAGTVGSMLPRFRKVLGVDASIEWYVRNCTMLKNVYRNKYIPKPAAENATIEFISSAASAIYHSFVEYPQVGKGVSCFTYIHDVINKIFVRLDESQFDHVPVNAEQRKALFNKGLKRRLCITVSQAIFNMEKVSAYMNYKLKILKNQAFKSHEVYTRRSLLMLCSQAEHIVQDVKELAHKLYALTYMLIEKHENQESLSYDNVKKSYNYIENSLNDAISDFNAVEQNASIF